MRENDILDTDIPGADPAAVIEQYEPYLQKLANRYTTLLQRTGSVDNDDLLQAGRIAVMDAQKTYDPGRDMSFIGWLTFYVKKAMRQTLGINSNTGEAPPLLVYLDESLPGTEDEDTTRLDMLEDPAAVPLDEPIIDEETRRETSEQVYAALDRMKSDKQRTAVKLVWLEGKTREQAAKEMEIQMGYFYSLEKYGRSTLRRDWRLRQYAQELPFIHVGVRRFNTTWTSATEYAALWRLEHLPDHIPRKEAAAEEPDTGRHWSPAQSLAYMNRLRRKRTEASEADDHRQP